jgi:hypothetical protein
MSGPQTFTLGLLGGMLIALLVVIALTAAPGPAPIQVVTPSPRTTLIDPVTTTPFPTRTP